MVCEKQQVAFSHYSATTLERYRVAAILFLKFYLMSVVNKTVDGTSTAAFLIA